MGSVHTVVEYEFGCWEVLHPVTAARVSKESKVLFNFLIRAFGLAVGLGVVSCH
jgi:hypothetical protein